MTIRSIILFLSLAFSLLYPGISYGCDVNEMKNDAHCSENEVKTLQDNCCNGSSNKQDNHDCGKDCKNHPCECSISNFTTLVNNSGNDFYPPIKYFSESFVSISSKIFLNGVYILIWNPPKR